MTNQNTPGLDVGHGAEKQPEALRLAAWLNEGAWHQMTLGDAEAAGRELRRLHAENVALRSQLATTAQAEPVMNERTAQLVLRFSDALRNKLAAAEKKYGYSDGWASDIWMDECRAKLMEHIAKGDPIDVAAYCAFLWHHNESTVTRPASAPVVGGDAAEAGLKLDEMIVVNALHNVLAANPSAGNYELCYLDMPLAEVPSYVAKIIENSGGENYHFVKAERDGTQYDVAHYGNGPTSNINGAWACVASPDNIRKVLEALERNLAAAAPQPPVCQQDSSNSEKQAGLSLKDARPPAGQQDRGEALKRATELHEKASMPWGQALELAMSEHGISLPLYQAINKLVCQIGYEGGIASDHALVTEVMDALHDLDGGTNIAAAPQADGQQEDAKDAVMPVFRFNGDRASASSITAWANSFEFLDPGEPNASFITMDGKDAVTDLLLAVDDEDEPVMVGDYVTREDGEFKILRVAITNSNAARGKAKAAQGAGTGFHDPERLEAWDAAGREIALQDEGLSLSQPLVEMREPAYWQWRRKADPWSLEKTFNSQVFATTDDSEVRLLYASPVWGVPLTDEEIRAICKSHLVEGYNGDYLEDEGFHLARAIEAAHSIQAAPISAGDGRPD